MSQTGTASMPLTRSVIWNGGALNLWELCRLFEDPAGWLLAGTVVGELAGVQLEVRYSLACSRDWHTRYVDLEVRREGQRLDTRIAVDAEGRWTRDEEEVPALRGLVDVDLSVTPATNTLPIRRLELAVGESAEVTAAWVRFPSLTVEPLVQRYTRTGERRYLYESGGTFRAELEVDAHGLVVTYGDYWRVDTGWGGRPSS